MNQGDAGREKMVNQLLSLGAEVATQSADLAKLVAERLACVTPPEPPEVAREAKEGVPAYPPLLNELQSYFKQIKTSLDKIKSEIHRMEIEETWPCCVCRGTETRGLLTIRHSHQKRSVTRKG